MTWLTLRQARLQLAVVTAAAAALAVALLVSGPGVSDLADATGAGFLDALAAARTDLRVLQLGVAATLVLPAVVGVFWGAPLVARELEAGTHRLAWTQGVTRTRWLLVKSGLTGLVAVAVAAALGLLVAWWCRPLDAAILAGHGGDGFLGTARMRPPMFAARGIVPIGYAAFALALGIAAGAFVRRTVPAMAITLAVFVAVQFAVPPLVRAHLAPEERIVTITERTFQGIQADTDGAGGTLRPRNLIVRFDVPGAWLVGNTTIDGAGRAVASLPAWLGSCFPPPGAHEVERGPGEAAAPGVPDLGACLSRLTAEGYRQRLSYQPPGRFWAFQAYETAAFLALAGVLLGASLWRVRRLS